MGVSIHISSEGLRDLVVFLDLVDECLNSVKVIGEHCWSSLSQLCL